MKKGFTLIELLGIIVILGTIAMITIPLISTELEKSKKNIAKATVQSYQKTISQYVLEETLKKNNIVLNGEYNLTTEGNIYNSSVEHEIAFDGKKPKNGTLTFVENAITTGCITIDKYKVEIENDEVANVEKGTCQYTRLQTKIEVLLTTVDNYIESIENLEITEPGIYNVSSINNQVEYDGELPTEGWLSLTYDETNGLGVWKYSIKYGQNEVITYDGVETTAQTELASTPAIILLSGTNGKTSGDEIAIGTEHFYVLENTGTKVIAIAKANLNVGDNKDDNLTEGIQGEVGQKYGVKFSEIVFWTQQDSPYIKEKYRESHTDYAYIYDQDDYAGEPGTNTYSVAYYVKNYINYLNTEYPGLNLTGRILTRWERNTYSTNHETILSTQTAWLATSRVDNANSSGVYYVYLATQSYSITTVGGVRPVIEFAPSKI